MTKTTLRYGALAVLLVAAGCGSDGGNGGTGGSGGKGGTGGRGGGGGAGHTGGTGGSAATGGTVGTGGTAGGGGTVATGGTAGGGAGGTAGSAATGGTAGGSAGAAGGQGGMGGMAGAGGPVCTPNGGVGGTAWLMAPTVPAAIEAPAETTVKVHDRGIGYQIYKCTASGGGAAGAGGAAGGGGSGVGGSGGVTYSWGAATPSANLYDSSCTQVGTHQAGPSWTSGGGTINGMKLQQADAPTAGNIPWLLLKVVSPGTTTGAFDGVTYIQRVNTVGGVTPSTTCNAATVGTTVNVPYSADYYFFTGPAGAGGAGGGSAGGAGGGAAGGAAGTGS